MICKLVINFFPQVGKKLHIKSIGYQTDTITEYTLITNPSQFFLVLKTRRKKTQGKNQYNKRVFYLRIFNFMSFVDDSIYFSNLHPCEIHNISIGYQIDNKAIYSYFVSKIEGSSNKQQ